ncbi:MAG: hypothetical protein J7J31_00240 [Helicobacteraceae bacterium]|nr:hypothetical protein [Helicobacteraceae bacterium]
MVYKCGMTASTATEPGFELKFPGLTPIAESNITIADSDTNVTVAVFDRNDGESVIFSTVSGTTIQRNKNYTVGHELNATHSDTTRLGTSLMLSLPVGTTTADASLILYSNSGDSTLDTATDTILETRTQFTGSFGTQLDAQIDASADFLLFNADGARADSTTQDSYTFTFANDKDIDFAATSTDVTYTVFADRNISTFTVTAADADTNDVFSGSWADAVWPAPTVNDYNITASVVGDTNGSVTEEVQLTVAPTEDMAIVNFTGQGVVTFDGGATKTLFSGVSAGNWTIYGYTAQIPNVAGLSTHDTVMKFTNRSSLNTNIYFTLIDPDGTTATLNSADNAEIASLNADTTGTYVASALLALVDDAAFDKTGSISVEVSIPTTPDAVYGMASFKNNALGQFKDLPVYNSSSMGY